MGAILGENEWKTRKQSLSPYSVAGRLTVLSHFISILLLITKMRNRRLESRQLAQSHAAGVKQRTPRLRSVQHQRHHLPTAPTNCHKKGTFTFEGTRIWCREGVGCIWFACLLKRLFPQSNSLDYFGAAMSFLSPLGKPWRMCKEKKETQEIYYWHSPSICYYDVHPAEKCLYPYKVPSINLTMLSPSRWYKMQSQ